MLQNYDNNYVILNQWISKKYNSLWWNIGKTTKSNVVFENTLYAESEEKFKCHLEQFNKNILIKNRTEKPLKMIKPIHGNLTKLMVDVLLNKIKMHIFIIRKLLYIHLLLLLHSLFLNKSVGDDKNVAVVAMSHMMNPLTWRVLL